MTKKQNTAIKIEVNDPVEQIMITHDMFTIDIYEWEHEYAAWLGHKDIGIKVFMFGMSTKDFATIYDFAQLVTEQLPQYEEQYTEEWMDM